MNQTDQSRAVLRQAVWAGPTKGDQKLVLLRLCEEADAFGIATVELNLLAAQVGHPSSMVRKIIARLVNRGDLEARRGRHNTRTFALTPRL